MKKIDAFLDFLNDIPMDEREAFASRCGTTFDYLRQVAYGNRGCREALAINIERESSGVITCEVLCPHVDWAYLRHSIAPAPAPAAQAEPPPVAPAAT